jgi:hypothetical protein
MPIEINLYDSILLKLQEIEAMLMQPEVIHPPELLHQVDSILRDLIIALNDLSLPMLKIPNIKP